ncbi:unnamed protein product, partial [marine sediment metagenome]
RKGSFASRVCKLIKDGEFDKALSSQQLTALLNEGPGKKVKVTSLKALMDPLQKKDIVKVKIFKNGKKYWLPGWIDKKKVEDELSLYSPEKKVFFLTGKDAWTDSNKKLLGVIK